MRYSLQFHHYQRRFRQPLQTSHGCWDLREGIILQLQNQEGKIGYGEVAPLPWFGSETLQEAWDFCCQLEEVTEEVIFSIPNRLPCCQFAFESALEDLLICSSYPVLDSPPPPLKRGEIEYSYLLPAGEDALSAWKEGWKAGGRTFKWKIGVKGVKEEIEGFYKLIEVLPETAKLRLDANGGLSLEEAKEWLRVVEGVERVEFIEQPLPPAELNAMLKLSGSYGTPLALDESVANVKLLHECYTKGWRGVYVIKGAIAGSPRKLRQFCKQHDIDVVFSSVFETEIGRKAVLRLAQELSSSSRAVGFGVNHWF